MYVCIAACHSTSFYLLYLTSEHIHEMFLNYWGKIASSLKNSSVLSYTLKGRAAWLEQSDLMYLCT